MFRGSPGLDGRDLRHRFYYSFRGTTSTLATDLIPIARFLDIKRTLAYGFNEKYWKIIPFS